MKALHASLVAALFTGALSAELSAGIIYSGLQNIPIPTSFDGVYLDVDTGATGFSAMTGWDINPFFGGAGLANSSACQPARIGSGSFDPYESIEFGTLIDGNLSYSSGFGGSGDPVSHLGNGADQFAIGQPEYLGFQFTPNGGGGPWYGWMQLILTDGMGAGEIVDWAYDDSGGAIAAGVTVVPEPSATCMLVACLGLAFARRRRTARH